MTKTKDELAKTKDDLDVTHKWGCSNTESSLVNSARVAGLQAQVDALTAALTEVSPQHPLLQGTEQRFQQGGRLETALCLVFEKFFDAEWVRKADQFPYVNKDPKAYRPD